MAPHPAFHLRAPVSKSPTKRIIGPLVASLVLFMTLVLAAAVSARPANSAVPDRAALDDGGLMIRSLQDPVPLLRPAPLLSTKVSGDISGMLAHLTVAHRFENPTDQWVEGIYAFPLPSGAAVNAYRLTVGERIIEGVIKEKEEAKRTYETARREGRQASLLESERPNIFTVSVANIGPHQTVGVELQYRDLAQYRDGRFSLRLPLVIGPRYIPGLPLARMVSAEDGQLPAFDGNGWATPTDLVPDAQRITPPVRGPEQPLGNPVALSLRLDAGLDLADVTSLHHAATITRQDDQTRTITFAAGSEPADRDFELVWTPVPGNVPAAGLFREQKDGRDYAYLMLVPPSGEQIPAAPPRDVTLIIDRSGSMEGASMEQAKSALMLALADLRPIDRFEVIWFSHETQSLFGRPVAADARTITRAQQAVAALTADGGTEMIPALSAALSGDADGGGRLRQVVLITDGAIGNEDQMFDLITQNLGDRRLFTVGIGSAPNGHLMGRAARLGRGSYTFIGRPEDVAERMGALLTRLERPVLTDISIDWPEGTEAWPKPVGDLFAGEPLMVAAKLGAGQGKAVIRGQLGGQPWQVEANLDGGKEGEGVAALWAKRQVESLIEAMHRGADAEETRLAVLDVALQHDLVTRWTSFVAVDKTPVRPLAESLMPASVPTNLPQGWSHDAVFGMPQGATGWQTYALIGLLVSLAGLGLLSISQRRRA